MNLFALPIALLALVVYPLAHAQHAPPSSFQNVLQSPVNSNVTVAYKQPVSGTCTTAFSTQKQYTGYIGLPPYTLAPIQQNYSINTFFWFIEARQSPETAPLTIWLNGGPGTSSMFGLFNEIGPCEAVQMADGTYGTQMRPFGWDRASNILFIDQPNQVGFSYDVATNASLNLFADELFEPPSGSALPPFMYLNGTFGTANENDRIPYATTANTTQIAAVAAWHFLQTWLSTFPEYNPSVRPNATSALSDEPAAINLFTESYGGKFGPAFAAFFDEQNTAIANGQLSHNSAIPIQLQSLGILNGLVDDEIQAYYYPIFAYNNTYGIKIISQTAQLNALTNYTNDCLPAILSCRSASADIYGDNDSANQLCEAALYTCNNLTVLAAMAGYNSYDIRQMIPSPDPPAAYQEYLNQESVLASIGARVNYTQSNPYVQEAFISTGDTVRGDAVNDLASLLKRGVRVALIYGDADYVCNWYGGQAVAYAIANALPDYPTLTNVSSTAVEVPPTYASGFAAAGFADVVANNSYVGGAVKQYGNLSFSRIYNSGHFVPYYQPETAFQVFARVIFGHDISLGTMVDLSTYISNGTANATQTNSVPTAPSPTCWVRSWNASCSQEETEAMQNGMGLVNFGIYYQDSSSISLPSSTVAAGVPGSPMTTTSSGTGMSSSGSTSNTALTGLYTATGTPKSSAAAGAPLPASKDWIGPVCILLVSTLCGASMMML